MRSSPASNSDPVQAGIYTRISLAVLGDVTKVGEQERICRELAAARGWHVAEGIGHPHPNGVYTDNNRSAWQQNRKRPAWDQMLADIEAGHINAIVVYHGDRLLRTHEDLLALIKLSRTRGVHLASPAGTRDLGNYDDQFILEIEASMAKRESANTSRRRKMQYDRWRREGRVRTGGRGGRSFAFTTDGLRHLPPQCCVVATREELSEADIVREIARRLLAGEGTISITRDLGRRGILNASGHPFSPDSLRKMMSRPRYAGLMPDEVSRGAWEPVLDRETWEAVCAVLAMKRSQFAYVTSARKHLLSGIAECGVCGTPLQVKQLKGHGTRHYACTQPGCRKVFRSMPLLDAYVSRRVVNRLAIPANPAPRELAAAGLAAQYEALEAQRLETEELVKDWQATPGRLDLLMARLDSIDARLAELRELAAGDARARVIAANEGLSHEEFAALPLATRRALVSACYQVIVLPASKRGPGFRTEDVRLLPRA